jgi:hypothetical protein
LAGLATAALQKRRRRENEPGQTTVLRWKNPSPEGVIDLKLAGTRFGVADFEPQAHTSDMPYYCGAPTADGTPCRHKVQGPGRRCGQHRGFRATSRTNTASRSKISTYPVSTIRNPTPGLGVRQPRKPTQPKPSQRPPTPTRRELEQKRVEEAAKFCADSLSTTWQDAVADRISDYAGTTWERLKRSRRGRDCKALARLATAVLKGKQQIHQLVGRSVSWIGGLFGADDFTRAFAAELAANIPLVPIDAKAVAVARGLQISGIVLCIMDNRDLLKCECFIDLALTETKQRVNEILIAGMSDWTGLARFTPSHSGI